jgi:hypothetical protein
VIKKNKFPLVQILIVLVIIALVIGVYSLFRTQPLYSVPDQVIRTVSNVNPEFGEEVVVTLSIVDIESLSAEDVLSFGIEETIPVNSILVDSGDFDQLGSSNSLAYIEFDAETPIEKLIGARTLTYTLKFNTAGSYTINGVYTSNEDTQTEAIAGTSISLGYDEADQGGDGCVGLNEVVSYVASYKGGVDAKFTRVIPGTATTEDIDVSLGDAVNAAGRWVGGNGACPPGQEAP